MTTARLICAALAVGLLFGCAEEPVPPTVDEFMSNRVLLDATMVRCSANRSSTKYEADCLTARDAINRIARIEEDARRAELEKQSERKRRALRRTQEAATLARRRAAEAARIREEQAYLAQFESGSGESGGPAVNPAVGPTPDDTVPQNAAPATRTQQQPASVSPELAQPAAADREPSESTDLQSIRDELKRRQDDSR